MLIGLQFALVLCMFTEKGDMEPLFKPSYFRLCIVYFDIEAWIYKQFYQTKRKTCFAYPEFIFVFV